MITRRTFGALVFAAAAALSWKVFAHEGHVHKVLGTVTMRHEQHLQVKATDGKSTDITLNEKTKILRGRTAVKLDDIKPGERVVVTAIETKGKDGKTTMVAAEVRLGTVAAPAAKK